MGEIPVRLTTHSQRRKKPPMLAIVTSARLRRSRLARGDRLEVSSLDVGTETDPRADTTSLAARILMASAPGEDGNDSMTTPRQAGHVLLQDVPDPLPQRSEPVVSLHIIVPSRTRKVDGEDLPDPPRTG